LSGGIFDWDNAVIRLDEVEHLAQDPDLWNRPEKAQTLMRERTQLTSAIEGVRKLETELSDSIELAELAELEGEDELVDDAVATLQKLATLVEKMRIESLLSGEADSNDCFLEVHAGAGGTESQDWAQMLLRMYTRWADRRGYKVEEMEESPGEEAGIKSATVKISGLNAYGWSKTETGVHRLVRISPYDSQARRHTSFASVGVSPVVDDSMDVELEDKDIRVDTYRASGAGGQHVNKTDSAIRMTHIPTGIAVQCQNSRSQHRNRAEALTMLKSRLYERELRMREEQAQAENAEKSDIGWGHQIRSYVLQPYRMVKDLRTEFETSNTDAVLDGDIDAFISAALAHRIGGDEDQAEAS
jgi:peptide chain release factor 2